MTTTTVIDGHCEPEPGSTAHQDAASCTTAMPSRVPVSTRLDRRATSATCSPRNVTSWAADSTGVRVSSGWPGARVNMSRPVMDSKLWRGTFDIHRPIAVAAREAISTAINMTMAMR